jgi:dihydrofolate synthase/folylpolyglutamate synthase
MPSINTTRIDAPPPGVDAPPASTGPATPCIEAEAIRRGIASVRWAGRLEWVDGLPSLLLDGAHNPAGCRALADYLDGLGLRPVLLFAAMRDKNVAGMLEALIPHVRAAVFTSPPMARACDPADLLHAARRARAPEFETMDCCGDLAPLHNPAESLPPLQLDGCFADPDVPSALALARRLAPRGGTVLVAGSLFLVGAVKEVLEGLPVRAGARA